MNFSDIASQYGIDPNLPVPVHAAIIMDGNGRWAKSRSLIRSKGHEKGAASVREITEACISVGTRYLTLYAFSTENWGRPRREIEILMMLLERFLKSEKITAIENNVKFNVIGQIERMPQKVRDSIQDFKESTCKNDGLILTLALSYGGRDELARAVRKIADDVQKGVLQPVDISEALIGSRLDTAGLPDPDILIRTGGDMRLSNFLPWQTVYTELFVVPTLWPDFNREEYYKIVAQFQKRERRFGKIK